MKGRTSIRGRGRAVLFSAATAAACLAVGVGNAAANGVAMAGDVTATEPGPSSATLWVKTATAGPVMVQARKTGSGDFLSCVLTRAGVKAAAKQRKGMEWIALTNATSASDLTAQAKVTGLPDTSINYVYRFCASNGWTSDTGYFNTAPSPNSTMPVHFAWSGDMDASPSPSNPTANDNGAYWNSFETLDQMREQGNDFNILMGDTIYSDSEVPGITEAALTVQQKWDKYTTNLEMPAYSAFRANQAVFNHWDDHEFINDFSPRETPGQLGVNIPTKQLYLNGVKAFRTYMPASYNKRTGLYRRVRYGKNLELFFLDERSFRSASADELAVCLNEGSPDLAPTAPQATRGAFAVLVESLGNPVNKACLASINSKRRTMLGKAQLAKFFRDVKASKATFKVVMSEVPMQQYYALPYDRWEGYAAERRKVLTYLDRKVKNVVILSTDVHATLVNNVRFNTLGPAGVRNSRIHEAVVGPIATKNYGLEMDDRTGQDGIGNTIQQLFFKQPVDATGFPGPGMGMQCAATDQFGFGQVHVSSTQLTVDFFDQAGAQTTEYAGDGNPRQACASLVIPKR
ncbi:MAG: alkaline phosphatase D family protein [bacterium]